jgi:ribosomal protein L16 Arg81 hydroxylase
MRMNKLAELIAPIPVTDFLDGYWRRSVLHLSPGGADAESLLSTADLERLIPEIAELGGRSIDIIGGPSKTGRGAIPEWSASDVQDALGRGSTVRLNELQLRHRPLFDLCSALELEFLCPINANVYMTPPSRTGLNLHFDQHDVFIIQVMGTKQWVVKETPVHYPVRVPRLSFERRGPRDVGETRVRESTDSAGDSHVTLRPGDLLYVPAGRPHETRTEESLSVGITIGVFNTTWVDLIQAALRNVANQDRAFMEPFLGSQVTNGVPEEIFAQLLSKLCKADFDQAFDELKRSFLASRSRDFETRSRVVLR